MNTTPHAMAISRRLAAVILAVTLVLLVLVPPAHAASATVIFANSCKVKIENGSGAWFSNPWSRTTEIENCAQVRASLNYWNGTAWTWVSSGWVNASKAEVQVSGITNWSKSRHGGRNVSGQGGRCVDMMQNGNIENWHSC